MIADHERWALSAAAVLALMVEPERLNGLILRDRPGPVREAFLELLHQVSDRPIQRLNSSPDPGALLASMDLGASLRAGRRIQGEGVLERAARSILIIPMAERLDGSVAAALAMALDRPDAPTMILLDEGADDEHTVPQVLADRMSISLNHDGLPRRAVSGKVIGPDQVMAARAQMARGVEDGAAAMTLTRLAGALGIGSLRAPILALRLARALAALDTAGSIGDRHIEVAALLCLAPRASVVPVPDDEPDAPPAEEDPKDPLQKNSTEQGPLEDRVLEAIAAAVPDLMLTAPRKRGGASATGAGDRKHSAQHGRPVRPRRGRPEGARLDIFATLLAAAPWQALRRREYPGRSGVVVLPDDFRIKQFEHPAESVLIFLVDASGSQAAARMAEAKGAVELMLAEAYRRREKVAMIAFRNQAAELILPPTRSLLQAKRRLAVQPGGGPTPLAAALIAGRQLAGQVRRQGATPYLVALTDGRGNIALDGSPGRAQAAQDQARAARALGGDGITAVLIDTANRPQKEARSLAQAMQARYLALPRADAKGLSRIARASMMA